MLKKLLTTTLLFAGIANAQTLLNGDIYKVEVKDNDTYVQNKHISGKINHFEFYSMVGLACSEYLDKMQGDIFIVDQNGQVQNRIAQGTEICKSLTKDEIAVMYMRKPNDKIKAATTPQP